MAYSRKCPLGSEMIKRRNILSGFNCISRISDAGIDETISIRDPQMKKGSQNLIRPNLLTDVHFKPCSGIGRIVSTSVLTRTIKIALLLIEGLRVSVTVIVWSPRVFRTTSKV